MVQSLPQSDGFRILFNSPELSEVQRSGFHLFLKNGISEELSKISCIQLKHAQFSIEIVLDSQDFRLVAPENNYRDCIIKMKSYTSKLYVQTKILFKDKISGELIYQTQPEWVLLADLPMMTKRGHFVINGSPRVIVHQVGRSPGVYFKKILKIKKDVNNKARFYGDIIPRKGVWVRLQINKKGDIDLKLKKSKKVRAEMVQKCLELLEKEKSKSIPFKGNRVISNLNIESQHFVGISNYRFNLGMEKQSFVSKSQSRCYTKSSYQKLLQVQNKVLQSKHLLSKTKVNQSTWHTKANHLQNPFLNLGKDDNRFSDYDTCLKPNHTDISFIQSQKQLFFSPQTSFLTGLGTNNSFSSKTRQTQAFVIGSPLNKPETVIHSICFHAIPWLRAIKESSVRVQTIIMSNKKQCFLFGRSKQSFCLKSHTQTARTLNKAKLFESSLSNTKINLSLNDKAIKSHSLSALKQESLYLLDKPSFTLGSQMYGTKRSSFTKAEKEAFTNVYISFYKNDIQDIKERVSMSVGKISQDSIKEDSLNSRLSAVTKISTEPRSKILRKISKKKIASKQDLSSNLEKVRDYLYQLFKRSDLYDLGDVGREKINTKFDISITETQLTALDIKETINWLSKLRAGKEEIDDIDHSQNRRVRTSSELIQAQFEVGVTRLRNLVTKKIRNGKIEQIRTLPFAFTNKTNAYQKYSVPMQKQRFYTHKLVDVKQSCTKATPLNATHLHMVYKSLPSTKLHFARSSGVQSIPSLYKVFLWLYASRTQPSRFDMDSFGKYQKPLLASLGRLHFKGGSNCFIRRATLIDQFKVNLKNRRIFTSINPYCLTFKKKKKYYSAFSKSRFADQRLNLQCTKTDKHLQNKSLIHTEQLQKRSDNFFIYTQIKTGDSVDLTSQNLLNSQSSQLLALPKQKFWYKQTFFAQHFSVSELFSTKPINGALREFFSSSPLSQYMDQTNPLAEITHKRRISSLGVGGVSRESAGMAIRGIHPTHYGRICPIETPEGKNAGLVNSLAFYAKINNQGFIETPYYPVIKGQVQHELGFSFYSAEEESKNGLYIAPNDIKQSKSKLLASNISTIESIPVRVADNILDLFKKVTPYQVDCIGISPVQILSVATSLIPFLEHNDANRALMGSNMQRQAVSLMISERPVIGTGLEARVLAESGHLVQSKTSGFVSNVSAHKVVVERLFKNFVFARTLLSSNSFVPCKQGFDKAVIRSSFNQKSLFLHTGCKQNHINLYQNQDKALQKQSFCICVPKRSFGTPTKVDLFENKGYGLLEAVVLQRSSHLVSFFICSKKEDWSVRERTLAKNKPLPYLNLFKSEKSHGVIETLIAPTQKNFQGFCFTKNKFALSPVAHSISTFSRSNQETCLIQKPLVEEGDWVQKGDMISDSSAGQKGELSVGKNVLIAYIPWQGYNFEDAIVISDRLVKEQLYTSLHIERYTVIVNDFKDKVVDTNEWFTGDLPGVDSKKRSHLQKSGLPVIGTILKEGDILVGKIKYSKKKPATPHEKLVCDILGEHNFSVQNSSLYVPKGVHEARVLTYKIKKRFEKALKNNLRPAGAPKIVHIFLGEKRNIQVGDKMSGRHGNKGIVSTILPKQDMPYLADGSPIDILLNPLGVPSRMNVGQVFECLLGLASTYLHQNFKVTSFDEFYGIEASQSLVFLKLYQARLQSGQNWLFQVSFPGKTRLTDGRSGECLDQWITVGRAYMLKLIHMVNEKIHARAIGPYALVTQQPLKGRAHKGGQRLGEMEVWAVEGFGAAYILQELLTKKSDDSIGRKEVLKAMLPKSGTFLDSFDPFSQSVQTEPHLGLNNSSKKENRLYSEGEAFNVLGQPDIFKVLICELQALCLDVGVYSMRTESFQRQFLGALE